ncbi:ribonuclease R family protein [Tumidithrix elongata RA019]|uniref:Ribonuclease R family protein n=1 Tax=Tumidithrix elongata BACA0141 TaxID=2716417 RepID=A0AAW9Q475_9CYAN|nr:ribonuclease R family protein [Tumidithrix elongata RA019]
MEKGTLVEFRLHGDRRLAVVDRPEGKKHLQVIDENGTTHTVHPREIDFVIKSTADSDPQMFTARQIPVFFQQVQQYLDPSSLEVAWEILIDDNKSVTPDDLANLLFSKVSAATSYASYWLLSNDKLYFKQKGDRYEPRPATQVAELKHQAEAAQQRQREAEAFICKMQNKIAGKPIDLPEDAPTEPEWTKQERHRLESLERYALYGEEASDKSAAQEILVSVKRTKSEISAFQLLVDLGIWNRHENLALLRSQVPTTFSAEVLNAVKQCLENPIPDSSLAKRIDLTHLHVYTIDDESTTEIDDGLSIETLHNGQKRLWIHIADPTRWIEPQSLLDREARKRGTSVYLPTGMIPMFPHELATGPMSLIQSQVCHALSFGVDLSDRGEVIHAEIHPSLIKPNYRLTYEDVMDMLDMSIEEDLNAIAQYAKLRTNWRLYQGAVNIDLPETIIKVNPNDTEQMTLELMDEPFSRQMVAEMMILAGEVAANFAQKNGIPIPYRYQEAPELPSEEILMQLPSGPVREFAVCRCMAKGEMGIYAARHAGLGLEAYTQATSPIRRYTDLLTHWQIKAFLNDAPLPFTEATLSDSLSVIEPAVYEANQLERQTVRYWSLEFLRRNRETAWRAILLDWLREQDKLGLVLLEDLGLKLPMRINRTTNVGESFNVKVSEVDPRKDLIQFYEVQQVESFSMA